MTGLVPAINGVVDLARDIVEKKYLRNFYDKAATYVIAIALAMG